MKIVETGDPRVPDLRSGVLGCVVLVGFLFIAGGAFAIVLAVGAIPVEGFFDPALKKLALGAGCRSSPGAIARRSRSEAGSAPTRSPTSTWRS
jgi:hypothetical protein